ncbi:hypothetical protein [Chromohalobacter israelensis]|uniref:hypothetical protein n=1 Tax=Chromohalobacter israelensis TaxID=141390 RepID=UPI000FFF313E|nr:hypothetical protein [Chromohalobacter salexigens]RXE48972.1 hypothetical protein B4O83_13740 [Chromohalobacter salexigens]
MKRFTLTVGEQSLNFTEQDIPALDEALNVATKRAGREVVRHSASGSRVSVLMERADSGGKHSTLPHDPSTVLMRDLHRGPPIETDC